MSSPAQEVPKGEGVVVPESANTDTLVDKSNIECQPPIVAGPYSENEAWALAVEKLPQLTESAPAPEKPAEPVEADSAAAPSLSEAALPAAEPGAVEQAAEGGSVAAAPPAQAVEPEKPRAPRPISEEYEATFGTIVGREHLGVDVVLGVNNQDSLLGELREDYGLIVVCDGCSKSRHSEVGAKIINRLFMKAFQKHREEGAPFQIVAAVQKDVLQDLNEIVDEMVCEGDTRETIIRDYFLSTVIGVFISKHGAFFWGMGDGVYGWDKDLRVVKPSPGNLPTYIGYHLCREWPSDVLKKDLEVYMQLSYHPTHVLVGSDGVNDLLTMAGRPLPGTSDKVPALEDIFKNDRYWQNADELSRQLRCMQKIHQGTTITTNETKQFGRTIITTEVSEESRGGYLPDDTTLAVLRLRPEPEKSAESLRPSWLRREPMSVRSAHTLYAPETEKPDVKDGKADAGKDGVKIEPTAPNDSSITVPEKQGWLKRIGSFLVAPFTWFAGLFKRKPKEDAPKTLPPAADPVTAEKIPEKESGEVDKTKNG